MEISVDPVACLLGKRVAGLHNVGTQKIISLAYASTSRIILRNWKVRKPNCFSLDNWLSEFLEVVSMEGATSLLSYTNRAEEELWTKIKSFIDAVPDLTNLA